MNDVLNFWFGEIREDAAYLDSRNHYWFTSHRDTDREIRDRFEQRVIAATEGKLKAWEASPRGQLALILLLDQFSRNIWRGTPRAFAQDSAALGLATQGVDSGADRLLHPIERIFFYLPFEHAESLVHQQRSMSLFSDLIMKAPAPLKPALEGTLDYAVRHYDIIRRFGRFPHRNKILGRASTPEEIEFLASPGSSF